MGEGYCIHCKQKVELKNGVMAYFKNGTPIERGNCSICNAKLARILNKQERVELKAQARKIDE